jgi:hypothetical protein
MSIKTLVSILDTGLHLLHTSRVVISRLDPSA